MRRLGHLDKQEVRCYDFDESAVPALLQSFSRKVQKVDLIPFKICIFRSSLVLKALTA